MEMVMRSYPNDWGASSIMHRKGLGGGSSSVTHELTEEKQGTYLYTIGPYADPVLSIEPGDRVIVETRDAFEGKITSESDVPSELLEVPFLNPQCGPDLRCRRREGRRACRSTSRAWRRVGPSLAALAA